MFIKLGDLSVDMGVGVCTMGREEVKDYLCKFFPTGQVLGIELRSSGLVAGAFTCSVMSLSRKLAVCLS